MCGPLSSGSGAVEGHAIISPEVEEEGTRVSPERPPRELFAAGTAAVYTIAHRLLPSLLGAPLPMSEETMDRRLFLGGSAATLGYFFTADSFSAARAADTPSEKVRFAGIGVGGKGQSDITQAARVGQVVALCDIDEGKMLETLNRKDKKGKEPPLSESKPRLYSDFRKML